MPPGPHNPITPKSVCTGALRVGGVPFRPDLMAAGAHVGDGGVLPDAAEGDVLVFRGGRWSTERQAPAATPAPPSSPAWRADDWAGAPPADLPDAVARLAHRLAASHGPIP